MGENEENLQNLDEYVKVFSEFVNKKDIKGQRFFDDIWIRANKYYVFFGEENQVGKTYALFSKQYLMTVELSKKNSLQKELEKIAQIIELYRQSKGLSIEKYEFWLPHCYVNDILVETKLIAESYGTSRDLALDYLLHYDEVFKEIYDKKRGVYFGLPLLSSYEEAENYILRDNTKLYLRGLKKLKHLI